MWNILFENQKVNSSTLIYRSVGNRNSVKYFGYEFNGLYTSQKCPVNTKEVSLKYIRWILDRQTTDVRQWDCETTCGWLESLGLESYVGAARSWLSAAPDARGVLASASHAAIEKELAIKHPLHKKKIVLALTDLLVRDATNHV